MAFITTIEPQEADEALKLEYDNAINRVADARGIDPQPEMLKNS